MFQTTNQSSLHTYHHIVAPLPGILSWSLMITTTIWVITSDPCMAGSQRWGERAAPSNKKQRSLKWGRSSTNMRLTHVNYVCGWMPPLIHGLLSGCVSPTEGVHWLKKRGDPGILLEIQHGLKHFTFTSIWACLKMGISLWPIFEERRDDQPPYFGSTIKHIIWWFPEIRGTSKSSIVDFPS